MATTNTLAKWLIGTSDRYAALQTKDPNGVYFLSDTKEVYLDGVNFTEGVIFYTGEKPTDAALNKLYVNSDTLIGEVWNGTAWVKALDGTVSAEVLVDGAGTTKKVSGAAVKAYIDSTIQGAVSGDAILTVSYNSETGEVVFEKDGDEATDPTKVKLVKFAKQLERNATTGDITLKDSEGTVLTTINIPPDNYTTSATYDEAEKSIVLHMKNGNDVKIPASAMLNFYNELDSNTMNVTVQNVDGKNVLSFDVKLSAEAGNILQVKEDGLYVVDATKFDKMTGVTENHIITVNAAGDQLVDTGATIGGAALAESPNASTVATEKAVGTAIDTTVIGAAMEEKYVKKANITATVEDLFANMGFTEI